MIIVIMMKPEKYGDVMIVDNIIYKLYIGTVYLLPLLTCFLCLCHFFVPACEKDCTVYTKIVFVQKINEISDLSLSLYFEANYERIPN